jgi:hypothetical protein
MPEKHGEDEISEARTEQTEQSGELLILEVKVPDFGGNKPLI